MMSRMLGAPLGATTRGGQYGVESLTLSLITPPKGIGGGGICFPSMVTVASVEPGVPLICCVQAEGATAMTAAASIPPRRICLADFIGGTEDKRNTREAFGHANVHSVSPAAAIFKVDLCFISHTDRPIVRKDDSGRQR